MILVYLCASGISLYTLLLSLLSQQNPLNVIAELIANGQVSAYHYSFGQMELLLFTVSIVVFYFGFSIIHNGHRRRVVTAHHTQTIRHLRDVSI
jgi:hypothetical protein